MVIISNQNLGDIITIVITLNFFYNNFDTMITSLLETKDKLIFQSKKIKNISKNTTREIEKLTMVFKNNNGPK